MTFKKVFLIAISIILVYSGIPIIFFLSIILPLSCLRKCVSFVAQKKWGWIPLSIQSGATAIDDIYCKPRANTLTVVCIQGPLPIKELERRLKALVYDQQKWPELTRSLTWWLGTYFWKPCENFSFHEHLQIADECTSRQEFDAKMAIELQHPFSEGKPLWKFIAFPNYKDHERNCGSALVFKFHHSLADGFGMMNFLRSVMDPDEKLEANIAKHLLQAKSRMRPTGLTKVLFMLRLVFVTPVEIFYSIFDCIDSNPWTIPCKRQVGEITLSCNTEAFNVAWLKEISKNCNSQITTLIFNAVTMAMARCMESRKNFSVMYPLPYPGHPGNLSNHLVPTVMKAPVSIKDRQKRLNAIRMQLNRKIFTPYPLGILAAVYSECLLCSFFRSEVIPFHFGTGIVSNFVFNSEPAKIFGSTIRTCTAVAGLQRKIFNFLITCISYDGKLNLVVTADKGLFNSEKEAGVFVEYIKEELTDCILQENLC